MGFFEGLFRSRLGNTEKNIKPERKTMEVYEINSLIGVCDIGKK